jgi:hypothetical protein
MEFLGPRVANRIVNEVRGINATSPRPQTPAAVRGLDQPTSRDLVNRSPRDHVRGGFRPTAARAPLAGAVGVTRMAGRLRRLIENLAVVKPGRKTSRSLSDTAKATLGLNVPIAEVLDNTLGPIAPRGTGVASSDGVRD